MMNATQAERIARDALAGIEDRNADPVILHTERVAAAAPEDCKVLAWLHDVVEDTDVTFDDLAAQDIDPVDLEALKLITRDERFADLTYMNWIRHIAAAPGEAGRRARAGKLCDVDDNISRPAATDADRQMKEGRYARARRIIIAGIRDHGESVPAG